MSTSRLPPLIEQPLRELQAYVHGFYPGRAKTGPIPVEFWTIEDDELFLEVLSYMPLKFVEVASTRLQELPTAFQIAYPIFELEDDYQVNGWGALTNAGTERLPQVISAYERIGMKTEAEALRAALRACEAAPDDDEAAETAYRSVDNPYRDDDEKYAALLRFFRANAHLWTSHDDA
jgi:hypothetical protein